MLTYIRDQGEQPVNFLRIDGRSCKLIRSEEQYRSVERTEGMIAYNGQEDNLIDRFDGRALLDFYRDPVPSRRQKSEEELELQEVAGPPSPAQHLQNKGTRPGSLPRGLSLHETLSEAGWLLAAGEL